MRVELEAAYLLHRRNYKENSLIIEAYTPNYGRVSLIAKGVKANNKAAGQRRGLLQLFQPLLLGWSGKGQLKTLIHAEASGRSIALTGNTVYMGLYVNELMQYLLPLEEAEQAIYQSYQATLQALQNSPLADVILRRFEITLLDYLGYGINFSEDAETHELIVDGSNYFFLPEKGFVKTPQQPVRQLVKYAGADIVAIAQGNYSQALRRVAKTINRTAIDYHLQGRALHSRKLYQSLLDVKR